MQIAVAPIMVNLCHQIISRSLVLIVGALEVRANLLVLLDEHIRLIFL